MAANLTIGLWTTSISWQKAKTSFGEIIIVEIRSQITAMNLVMGFFVCAVRGCNEFPVSGIPEESRLSFAVILARRGGFQTAPTSGFRLALPRTVIWSCRNDFGINTGIKNTASKNYKRPHFRRIHHSTQSSSRMGKKVQSVFHSCVWRRSTICDGACCSSFAAICSRAFSFQSAIEK